MPPRASDPPRLTAALGPAAVPAPPDEPALIRAVSGSLAAMLSEAVTHPIDLVKVRLQLTRGATGPDMVRTVAALVRDEGAASLLLGVRPALYRQAVYQYVRMGAYEPIRDAVSARAAARKGGKAGRRKLLLWQQLVAGGLAGAMGTLVASPLDLVKVRQQAGADMHAHLCAAEALLIPRALSSCPVDLRRHAQWRCWRGAARHCAHLRRRRTMGRLGPVYPAFHHHERCRARDVRLGQGEHTTAHRSATVPRTREWCVIPSSQSWLLSLGLRDGVVAHSLASALAGLVAAAASTPVHLPARDAHLPRGDARPPARRLGLAPAI